MLEETGWRIVAPRRLGTFQRFTWMPDYGIWGHKVQAIYTARAVRSLGPPLEPGNRPVWLPAAAAARRLHIEGDREMVRRAMAAGLA